MGQLKVSNRNIVGINIQIRKQLSHFSYYPTKLFNHFVTAMQTTIPLKCNAFDLYIYICIRTQLKNIIKALLYYIPINYRFMFKITSIPSIKECCRLNNRFKNINHISRRTVGL